MTSRFKFWASLAFLLLCVASPLHADDKPKDPDPAANPVLASILKQNAKLYFLGNHGGVDGWLIYKDGQVQFAYDAPNSKYIVIGALFGPDGENASSEQIQALLTTNKELNALLSTSFAQQAGAPPSAVADPMAAAQAQMAAAQPLSPSAFLPPGERLMKDLQNAAGVNLGNASAPLLLMIMDPNCPHCQATWKALRDSVFANKLQIRLVPIGAQGTDHERAAAQLLHVADPLNVWDKYVGGDKTQLAGTPDAAMTAAIRSNSALVDSWHIEMTPYLVYRAKDGKVKIVAGEPEQAAAILGDIGG